MQPVPVFLVVNLLKSHGVENGTPDSYSLIDLEVERVLLDFQEKMSSVSFGIHHLLLRAIKPVQLGIIKKTKRAKKSLSFLQCYHSFSADHFPICSISVTSRNNLYLAECCLHEKPNSRKTH